MSRRAWTLILLSAGLGLVPEMMIARSMLLGGAVRFPASIHTAPLARDFLQFWGAGWLLDHGQAATLFHPAHFQAWVLARFPFLTGHYRWGYPPGMVLFMVPFGLLPPLAAWILWMLGGTIALASALGFVFGSRCLPALMLATLILPIYWDNFLVGQAMPWLAALTILGFGLLDRRPVLAGLAFGLLTVKPPLAMLAPVALLAAGAWRSIIAAAATAVVLAIFAAIAMPHAWPLFISRTMPEMTSYLQRPYLPTPSQAYMASPFYAAEGLHLTRRAAWLIQASVTLLAIAALWRLWRAPAPDPAARSARMAASAALCVVATPYAHVYDALAPSILLCAVLLKDARAAEGWTAVPAMIALWQPGWSLAFALAMGLPVLPWAAWLAIGCGIAFPGLIRWSALDRLEPVGAGTGGLHVESETVRERREGA